MRNRVLFAMILSRTLALQSRLTVRINPARSFATFCREASSTFHPDAKLVNLSTITKEELEILVQSWGHPKYRGGQVYQWIRSKGVLNVDEMTDVPKKLREQLQQYSKPTSLSIQAEMVSKDGTIKRAYRCGDGQLIESVLMPYDDGRYTACISSQAGCAMGCVFCATGQMGFARQLSADEIFEQVSLFSQELQQKDARLSNIVFMGMGEPLANYRNVKAAINRISSDIGIGGRKITVSTVGIVPNIRKLMDDPDLPQVRLAVSLHSANDKERSALLPANARYGGLDELMPTLRDFIQKTGRRITLEWALIEGQNDTPETAQQLGRLVRKYRLRPDMVHINVIPLNPTGGFAGSPSQRPRVDAFCDILQKEFGLACTPRVRRGIDIDAGCGQLKAKVLRNSENEGSRIVNDPTLGVYEELDDDDYLQEDVTVISSREPLVFDHDSLENSEFDNDDDDWDNEEATRLIDLVQGTTIKVDKSNNE